MQRIFACCRRILGGFGPFSRVPSRRSAVVNYGGRVAKENDEIVFYVTSYPTIKKATSV